MTNQQAVPRVTAQSHPPHLPLPAARRPGARAVGLGGVRVEVGRAREGAARACPGAVVGGGGAALDLGDLVLDLHRLLPLLLPPFLQVDAKVPPRVGLAAARPGQAEALGRTLAQAEDMATEVVDSIKRKCPKGKAKHKHSHASGSSSSCVNVGCVPKKLMFTAATHAEAAELAPGYGLDLGHPRVAWPALVAKRDAYVARLNEIYARNLDNASIDRVIGRAKFVGPREVEQSGRAACRERV